MNLPQIHAIIKEKRRERDLTQEELAHMLGVTKAAVSKWENAESYPDIILLPRIAQLFHITMDELFGYTPEFKPMKIVHEIHVGFALSDLEDYGVLDHGIIQACTLQKCERRVGDEPESVWEVRVHMISHAEDFPYVLQKYMKPGRLLDLYSYRLADGKIVEDDKPNKHYVCREKVWEYRTTDKTYMREMFREMQSMGLLDDDA